MAQFTSAARLRTWFFAGVGTLASTGMLWNLFDTTGAIQRVGHGGRLAIMGGFVVASVPALYVLARFVRDFSMRSQSRAEQVAIVVFLAMIVLQVLGYFLLPLDTFVGSERDDIQYGAVRTLLDGGNPYDFIISWGSQNSTLPGLLLLQVPFVATGTLFLMHFVVLGGLLAVSRMQRFGSGPVLAVLLAMLAMPVVWRQSFPEGAELITGDLLLVLVVASACGLHRIPARYRPALYVMWGVFLCAKTSYFCVWPLLLRIVMDRTSARQAVCAAFLSAMTAVALVVPFLLWEPTVFSPLETSDFVALYDHYVPGAGKVVLMLLAATIVWAVGAPPSRGHAPYFLRAASIMAVPVLPIFVLPLVHGEIFSPRWWPTYLIPSALLAAWAAGLSVAPTADAGGPVSRLPLPLGLVRVFQLVGLAAAVILILATSLGTMKPGDPLMSAIDERDIGVVEALVSHRNLNVALGMRSSRTNAGRFGREAPLVQASRRGDPAVTTLLLRAGASVDWGRNRYALCAARYFKAHAVVELLLASGASDEVWCGKRRAKDMN